MIVDGHNDLVLRLWRGEKPRHLDLLTARSVGFAGGFFALYVPSAEPLQEPVQAPYDLPLPPPVPPAEAAAVARELAATLMTLDVRLARHTVDFTADGVAAVMHLEGAEPLAPDLSDLSEWYDLGVRSVGIVWSRPNAFGHGVPFRFPSSPDTGPGLTEAGRSLVTACNRLGIVVDVSHLTEAGFWDVADLTDAPLVATHSNAHTLCPSSRNLTDAQLDRIGASHGVVGVNFAAGFLRADGRNDADTPLAEIVRHVEYLVERIGADSVAFGSDFEGAVVPAELGGAAGLPRLLDALRVRGFDDDLLADITHRNWLRVLDETWRPWRRYFEAAGDDPRATLLDAVGRFSVPGLAVDLGAGTGRDTAELLRRGWHVIAIDREREAIERLRALVNGSPDVDARVQRFEDAEWPACDLVNASFALPFAPRERFPALWQRIVASLRPGGRFCGQLFGEHDEWAGGVVAHTRAEVERLLAPFAVERLDEVEQDAPTTLRELKHWHLFHVVARKR